MGASFADNRIRRKLPQALARDGGPGKTVHGPETLLNRSPLLTLQAALPTALFAGRCRGLAVKILADLLVLLLNFAAVIRLPRLMEFAILGDSSVLLPTLPFSGPDLGFPLLYGALVILLAHAEGLYESDLSRMQREERVILAKVVAWATLLVGAQFGCPKFRYRFSHSPSSHRLTIWGCSGGATCGGAKRRATVRPDGACEMS